MHLSHQSVTAMSNSSIRQPSQSAPPLVLLAAWLENTHHHDDSVVSYVPVPRLGLIDLLTRRRIAFQQVPPELLAELGPVEQTMTCGRYKQSCSHLIAEIQIFGSAWTHLALLFCAASSHTRKSVLHSNEDSACLRQGCRQPIIQQ